MAYRSLTSNRKIQIKNRLENGGGSEVRFKYLFEINSLLL